MPGDRNLEERSGQRVMTGADHRAGLAEPPKYFVAKLRELHDRMRERLVAQLRRETIDALSGVSETRGGDTIYEIDERGEAGVPPFFEGGGRGVPVPLVRRGVGGCGGRA